MNNLVSTAASRRRWMPVWITCCVLGAAIGLRLASAWGWPLPFCLLRLLTGLPCPACGCTRSLLAWTHFEPVAAFAFNPLFSVSCLVGAGWLSWRLAELLTGRSWAAGAAAEAVLRKLPWGKLVAILAVLNWIYLCFNLPK